MPFWVLENTNHNYVKIHRAECGCCKDGQGPRAGHTGLWLGPFANYTEALATARNTNRRSYSIDCRRCNPRSSG